MWGNKAHVTGEQATIASGIIAMACFHLLGPAKLVEELP
jgi:hypothetical protein